MPKYNNRTMVEEQSNAALIGWFNQNTSLLFLARSSCDHGCKQTKLAIFWNGWNLDYNFSIRSLVVKKLSELVDYFTEQPRRYRPILVAVVLAKSGSVLWLFLEASRPVQLRVLNSIQYCSHVDQCLHFSRSGPSLSGIKSRTITIIWISLSRI